MSFASVMSRGSIGINAPEVTVETHLSGGLPRFNIVGLPEAVVKESKDRVRSALINSRFQFPSSGRITVNLAPVDLPKHGGRFDLPIALSILAASKQIPLNVINEYEFAGELGLTGELRPFTGALPFALAAKKDGKKLMFPPENAIEAAVVSEIEIYAAKHLNQICSHLQKIERLMPIDSIATSSQQYNHDLSEVKGHHEARRALEIAAAGGHSLLMIGPPGTGKTMLASRLNTILPPLTDGEALEVAAVQSISTKGFNAKLWKQRPFRAPHHTASAVALVGGGSNPRPGEISLAHYGILFLDELPEYDRKVLEVLREPLESGTITISRAQNQVEFPARFQLIAAMNPCPCGYFGDKNHDCRCTPDQIVRYRNKLSGPLLDRIDMQIEVGTLKYQQLLSDNEIAEDSGVVKQRVINARQIQLQRQQTVNHALNTKQIEKFCALSAADQNFMLQVLEKLKLSARVYHRLLRVARTIADLEATDKVERKHLLEALSKREMAVSNNFTHQRKT